MKKIYITLVFAVLAIFAFNNSAISQTTINFYLSLTDNRSGCSSFTGYYYVRVFIMINGNEILCQHDQSNIVNQNIGTAVQITWVCSANLSQWQNYQLRFDLSEINQNPPPTYLCGTSKTLDNISKDQLTNGSTIYLTLP